MRLRSYNNANNEYNLTTSGGNNNNNVTSSYYPLPDCSRPHARWCAYSAHTRDGETGSRIPVGIADEQFGGDGYDELLIEPINPADPLSAFTFDSLYEANEKCKRGVSWKDSVASFQINRSRRVANIENRLSGGAYKHGKIMMFDVIFPKHRKIISIGYTDRVIQRSLCDNVLTPILMQSVIYDNCACQTGKGTEFAIERLVRHLRKHYRKHGTEGYILKCDIKEYYSSISMDVAVDSISKIGEPYLSYAIEILDMHKTDNGFHPGSQMVQIVGIMVLNEMDHFIKERMRVKHYVRYMDDFILISDTYEEAARWNDEIAEKLSEIGLKLNERKTSITPISKPFDFVGFTFSLRSSGKVTYSVSSRRIKAKRKQLFRFANKDPAGMMESYRCYRAHMKRGNCFNQLSKMDAYVRRLKDA